jgi:hypothetical protein
MWTAQNPGLRDWIHSRVRDALIAFFSAGASFTMRSRNRDPGRTSPTIQFRRPQNVVVYSRLPGTRITD